MTKKIAITDLVHPLLISGLNDLGFILHYNTAFTTESLSKTLHEYTGIIVNSKIKADARFLSNGTNLKFVARLGSGLDIIDQEYAKEMGIRLLSAPRGNSNAVAEHTLGMLLCLMNNINIADDDVRAFKWDREPNRGIELSGKTIGIIGFGNTGSMLAKKLKSWEMNILAYDKYNSEFGNDFSFVKSVSLADLQKWADIISFHVPLTKETEYYFDKKFMGFCKDGFILINTSRGKVVSLHDLEQGLKSGKIGGACLDVLENENPSQYSQKERALYGKLFEFKNLILTPHIAGWSKESLQKIAEIILESISALKITG